MARLASLRREPLGRLNRKAFDGIPVSETRDRETDRRPRADLVEKKKQRVDETKKPLDENCKGRPKSNASKGGGSRPFVKWCR